MTIQVVWYDSLVVARQNVPITSILTDFISGSWKDFDGALSLIGSKEIIWITYLVFLNVDLHKLFSEL